MMMTILGIVGSILTMLASWYVSKKVVQWIQAYRTAKQRAETEAFNKESEEILKKRQEEHDRLKDIEGR